MKATDPRRSRRRDPSMTARRATIIRSAHDRYEAARKGFDEKRYKRGGGYTPEDVKEIARRAGTKAPSNRAKGHLEKYEFMANPPDQIFAYYKDSAKVGELITNWMGQRLGVVIHRGTERRPMGGRVVSIRMKGDNGVTYGGNCNLSSGTYCRLKRLTSVRADPRRARRRSRR
jgi:hypothetical protein